MAIDFPGNNNNKDLVKNLQPPQITPQMIQNSDSISCSECGGNYFIPVMVYRKISKLAIGAAKDIIVPIPAAICSECGTPLTEMDPLESPKETK